MRCKNEVGGIKQEEFRTIKRESWKPIVQREFNFDCINIRGNETD